VTGEAELVEKARALADAIEAALGPWIVGAVRRLGGEALVPRAEAAAERARREVLPEIRALLEADIDDQATTPLALLRRAVRYPTEVLAEAGVAPVERDEFAVRAFPDDVYDLSPASFDALDPALRGPGIEWGAAKAFVHKARHGGSAS
jgi:hypothetical protein